MKAPFGYIVSAYDIVYLIADAIAKNSYDSEALKIISMLVEDYNGAAGKITMDQNGDPIMEYSVQQVKNSVVVPAQATPSKG